MKKSTKILTLLLSLILTFSVFAISAFASESTESINEAINEATSNKIEIDFSFERFVDSLQYMWKGMLCIFIVIFVLIVFVYLLNGMSSRIEAIKADKENEKNGGAD